MQGSVAYVAPPPPPKWLTSRLFCSWEVRSFSMAHFGRSVGVGTILRRILFGMQRPLLEPHVAQELTFVSRSPEGISK